MSVEETAKRMIAEIEETHNDKVFGAVVMIFSGGQYRMEYVGSQVLLLGMLDRAQSLIRSDK